MKEKLQKLKEKWKGATKKQKIIIVAVILVICAVLGMLFGKPKIEKINVSDLTLFKNEEKKIEVTYEPENADSENLSCHIENKSIANYEDGSIKGLEEGTTKFICEAGSVKKEVEIKVELTEEQQAEKEAKEAAELEKKRNTLTNDEKSLIKYYVEDVVKESLKSPSSAKFPGSGLSPFEDWNMKKIDNLVTVSSYVDADNSFGANIRTAFIAQVKMTDDGNGKLTYLEMGGEVYYGERK